MPLGIKNTELLRRRDLLIQEHQAASADPSFSPFSDSTLVPFLTAFSETFEPYKNAAALEQKVEEWAITLGIWDKEKGPHYNTMFSSLHPETSNEAHLVWAGKLYAFLYYVDDRLGNDTQAKANIGVAKVFKEILVKILQNPFIVHEENFLDTIIPAETKLDQSNQKEVLKIVAALQDIFVELHGLTGNENKEWLNFFYETLGEHLIAGTTNHDSVVHNGELWTSDEYSKLRIKVAGMNLAEALMELVTENYRTNHREFIETAALPTEALLRQTIDSQNFNDLVAALTAKYQAIGLQESSWLLETLRKIQGCSKINVRDLLELKSFLDLSGASEWNDVMSLWKELLDEGSIFNLVAVTYLTNPDLGIEGSIETVSAIIDLKVQLSSLIDAFIADLIKADDKQDPEFTNGLKYLQVHFKALMDGQLASNKWQKETGRYKSPKSLIRA